MVFAVWASAWIATSPSWVALLCPLLAVLARHNYLARPIRTAVTLLLIPVIVSMVLFVAWYQANEGFD